ncbi:MULTISPECIES: hypothetical protein [unclassified Nocardioides]|uniref:hypothetical protein n=1 Tax=unclassified Nocardioides TaxID=2615069 RepID=UPI0010561E0B|nr:MULTISPECIES: hypothetical protein [unclassified Nocardioides]
MPGTRPLVFLSPLVGAVLVVAAYRLGYDAEAGSRAGAEPTLAGAWVAGPFVVLLCAQVSCAVGMYVTTSARARALCAAGAAGLLLVGLVRFWLI